MDKRLRVLFDTVDALFEDEIDFKKELRQARELIRVMQKLPLENAEMIKARLITLYCKAGDTEHQIDIQYNINTRVCQIYLRVVGETEGTVYITPPFESDEAMYEEIGGNLQNMVADFQERFPGSEVRIKRLGD